MGVALFVLNALNGL